VSHETGDWLIRGKAITDPDVITQMNQHIGRAEDEADIWLPARMTPVVREALDGHERSRQGPGQHTFAELLEATQTSAIRIEMRDTYDETEKGYAEWRETGDISHGDWSDHFAMVRAAAARGVTMRRVRVISEPVSEYIKWENACTHLNIEAGEDIRWLPRTKAADLMLPVPTAGSSTTGSSGGTSSEATAPTHASTPTVPTPASSATSSQPSTSPGTAPPRTLTTRSKSGEPCRGLRGAQALVSGDTRDKSPWEAWSGLLALNRGLATLHES
jgi:hypothetical protein